MGVNKITVYNCTKNHRILCNINLKFILHKIIEIFAAKQFYLSLGFVESPLQAMTLVMTIKTVRSILEETN